MSVIAVKVQGTTIELSRSIFRISALILIAGTCMVTGALFVITSAPPAKLVFRAVNAFSNFANYGFFAPPQLIVLTPSNAEEHSVFHDGSSKTPTGWHAIMAFDVMKKDYRVTLYDNAGATAHQWKVFDRSGLEALTTHDLVTPHGLVIGRDGSVTINGGVTGFLAKFDKCGKQLWRREGAYDHQISVDDDGFLWVWNGQGSPYSPEQWIERIDPKDGKTVERISLIDEILKDEPDQIQTLGVPLLGPKKGGSPDADIFHTNDVEILSKNLATHFPMFEAGDILISLRNINLVAVVDRMSHKIKWSSKGPWRRQHDPDFMETGEISVFNNNFPVYYENIIDSKTSTILAIDPSTRRVREILGRDQFEFFSHEMGAHSWISGNILEVVSPFEGRVFDLDLTSNTKIFAFNNLISKKASAHVAMAEWLPEGYFDQPPSVLFDCPAEKNNGH